MKCLKNFFPPQRNLSFWVSLQLLSESFSRRRAELRPERRCRISFRHTANEGRAELPRLRRQKNPNTEHKFKTHCFLCEDKMSVLWWFLILLNFFLEAMGVSINPQFLGHTQPTPAQKIRLFLVCSWSTQGATEDPICAARVWVCVCVAGAQLINRVKWHSCIWRHSTSETATRHTAEDVFSKFAFNFSSTTSTHISNTEVANTLWPQFG